MGRTSLRFVAGGLGLAGYHGFGPGWISGGLVIVRPTVRCRYALSKVRDDALVIPWCAVTCQGHHVIWLALDQSLIRYTPHISDALSPSLPPAAHQTD